MKRNTRIKKRSPTLANRATITGRDKGAGTDGMRLSELKALWQAEREAYKQSEVGTGVQRFVWEMLRSDDLFGLTQGLKSTPDHKRRSEYLLEERRKNGQADAVIFMDSEVVIPVEAGGPSFARCLREGWGPHSWHNGLSLSCGGGPFLAALSQGAGVSSAQTAGLLICIFITSVSFTRTLPVSSHRESRETVPWIEFPE